MEIKSDDDGRATRWATGTGWKPVEHWQCLAGSTPAPSAMSVARQMFREVKRTTPNIEASNKKESHRFSL